MYATSSFTFNPVENKIRLESGSITESEIWLWNGYNSTGLPARFSIGLGYSTLGNQSDVAGNSSNTAIGYQSQNLHFGRLNTTLGALTLINPEVNEGEGIGNIAVGYEALRNNSELLNTYGIAIGYQALYTGGSDKDIAIGYQALYNGSSAGSLNNIAIGNGAMLGGATGDGNNNIAIGTSALVSQINNGANNIAIGLGAGDSVTSGDDNVLIGAGAGGSLTTGTGNIVLGGYAGKTATQNYNVAISDGAGNLRIFVTGSNGDTGVNTNSPSFKLDVVGTLGATLSTNSDGAYLVAHNSSTREVQYTPQIAIDDNAFNPSGSGVASNNTWLISADGYSIDSQVYMGYVSDTTLGASGGSNNTLLTIPRDTYAAIWIEYVTADSTYANMRTQTFIAHWDNASAIEWTNTGPEDIGSGTVPPSLTATISSTNVLVQAVSTAANQRMFGTYRLIKKI